MTRTNVVHALLYLVSTLLGAGGGVLRARRRLCRGAAEIIVYAGAIVVLFVFVAMTVGCRRLGDRTRARDCCGSPGRCRPRSACWWRRHSCSASAMPIPSHADAGIGAGGLGAAVVRPLGAGGRTRLVPAARRSDRRAPYRS
ncbi:MAG: NADH-quinone oxidoreductase subunit J [Rhodopseudomonas palustris]|nr:NADH-quinone oxidoreductase subunit J [Rhodopseudomonas palustris]